MSITVFLMAVSFYAGCYVSNKNVRASTNKMLSKLWDMAQSKPKEKTVKS